MPAVKVDKVDKSFSMNPEGGRSFLARLLAISSRRKSRLQALSGVCLEVARGEVVGLIGRNGSGKSTLLRVIAGIYRQDAGKVEVSGKLVSIIGFGSMLSPRLTMMENIVTSCAIYGLDMRTIRDNMDSIVNFAELEKYRDEPLYKFSAGMIQRLAFSIVVHCISGSGAAVLLLDEVFAVGDRHFVGKSISKLREIFSDRLAIIIAGHDLEVMSGICGRMVWIDDGRLVADGNNDKIIREYEQSCGDGAGRA